MMEMLRHRVRDGVLLRLIGKWLNAGVLEGLELSYPEAGTPQGGVISPLLANIYLHEVLDDWFVRQVQPRLRGRAWLIRYADDFVIVFERQEDARRVHEVLPQRFARFGLTLHPDKTRLLNFRRPDRKNDADDDDDKGPRTFDLLGFTHVWGLSRRGKWVVQKRTASSRFSRSLHRLREWCQKHRHDSVEQQHSTLSQKLRGHYAYFGITGNSRALGRYFWEVVNAWHKWLSRRSYAAHRTCTWEWMLKLLQRLPLPRPRIIHRYGLQLKLPQVVAPGRP